MHPDIPSGFTRMSNGADEEFVSRNGPLYGKREGDRFVLGFRVEQRHCNPGNTCHGGMLGTLADMLLIHCSNMQARLSRYLLTVNLTCDFIGPAPLGAWLEGRGEVLRVTKSLVFAQGLITADGEPVLRTNGVFKIPPQPDPRHDFNRFGL
jgi:uncharacterized protein (TIGR00369 family)